MAARQQAHLIFIDETGFLLHPLVRRTWSLRGLTPIMKTRMRWRRRVSAIGAVAISPGRRHLGWYVQFHLDKGIAQEQVIEFLRQLLRHLRGRLVIVWDRLGSHQSKGLRQWLRQCRRLHLEFLPPYAPELNPNEYAWAHLKMNPLANFCPEDVEELHDAVATAAESLPSHQCLLRSFVRATKLPLRMA